MTTATATKQRVSHPNTVGRMTDGTDGRRFRATYDAAQSNTENMQHWAAADALSANSANSASTRAILRFRARYEYANNTYCQGMLLTLANEVIGDGPRLQIQPRDAASLTDDASADRSTRRRARRAAQAVESLWREWAHEVCFGEKLRTARLTRARDGEVFLVAFNNPALRNRVKLDFQLIEADQVSTPALQLDPTQPTDGIVFDRVGNPVKYHLLKVHPGEQYAMLGARLASPLNFDTVDAAMVSHLFRTDRPGQKRGVPEITAALPLFALLRRYTLATVAAAETAADLAAVITSKFAPDGDEPETLLEPNDLVEIIRRVMMVLPEGYDIKQFDPKQPTTAYPDFKRELVNEIARVILMPFNIAAGNSAGYNYASGRLDHQVWDSFVRIDRRYEERHSCDFIFGHWIDEASRIAGYLPIPDADRSIAHQWYWPGRKHVDPVKEAAADDLRLGNGSLSFAEYYAGQGRDWREEFEQIAEERRTMAELGITPGDLQPVRDRAAEQVAQQDAEESSGGEGGDRR